MTIGIEPTRPETGYGYIFAEEKRPEEVVKVREFKEKPDLVTAKEYLAAGTYFGTPGYSSGVPEPLSPRCVPTLRGSLKSWTG